MFTSLPRCLLLSLTVLSIAACIPIPYKPGAEVSRGEFVETPPTLSVQYVEGEVLPTLAKKIQSKDKGIIVVAHKDLEAIAFPEGDITLDRLLEPDRRGRLQKELGLSYLVLIGDLTTTELSQHGGFIPLLGAGTTTELASVAASVIDLADGKAVTDITSISKGWGGGVVYGFYGLIIVPMTDSSAYDGVARGVVEIIRGRAATGPCKIAIALATDLRTNTCPGGVGCPDVGPATTTEDATFPTPEEASPPAQPPPAETPGEPRQLERP
jgi:hypothetical protein